MNNFFKRYKQITAKKEHEKEMDNIFESLITILGKNPNVFRAHYLIIVLILNERGDKVESEKYGRRAVNLFPNYVEAHCLLL